MDPKTVFFTGIFLMLLMAVIWTEGETSTGSTTTVHHVYHYVKTPKTWSEAQSFCREYYTELATVDNMEEQKRLEESIGNAAEIWIGLKRSATERWVWSEGKEKEMNWNEGSNVAKCVYMGQTGRWITDNCSHLRPFLCFKSDSNGGKSYTLNTTTMSWQDAQSSCRQHYTDLVSVTSHANNLHLKMLTNGIKPWIGGFRDSWMWSDRSAGSFRNWGKSKPDNLGGFQNCVAIRRYLQHQWDDSPCDANNPFVCYGELKIKRTVVKVKICSEVNPSLPTVSDSLLKQFQARLEEEGMSDIKTRWRADKNAQIFHLEQDDKETTKKKQEHKLT